MMHLQWHEARYSIRRGVPGKAAPTGAFAVLRTPEETTIVCDESIPLDEGLQVSGPWTLFRIAGALPHDAIGILAALSARLSEAEVPIFALSSFDTDYVLVPAGKAQTARNALSAAGYTHGAFS
jgi:uncharacterized protein